MCSGLEHLLQLRGDSILVESDVKADERVVVKEDVKEDVKVVTAEENAVLHVEAIVPLLHAVETTPHARMIAAIETVVTETEIEITKTAAALEALLIEIETEKTVIAEMMTVMPQPTVMREKVQPPQPGKETLPGEETQTGIKWSKLADTRISGRFTASCSR